MRVRRGIKKIRDVGKVVEYDEKKNISIWNDKECDAFDQATDGSIFHPFFDKKGRDKLSMYSPDICRRLIFHYDKLTYKYTGMLLRKILINANQT